MISIGGHTIYVLTDIFLSDVVKQHIQFREVIYLFITHLPIKNEIKHLPIKYEINANFGP